VKVLIFKGVDLAFQPGRCEMSPHINSSTGYQQVMGEGHLSSQKPKGKGKWEGGLSAKGTGDDRLSIRRSS